MARGSRKQLSKIGSAITLLFFLVLIVMSYQPRKMFIFRDEADYRPYIVFLSLSFLTLAGVIVYYSQLLRSPVFLFGKATRWCFIGMVAGLTFHAGASFFPERVNIAGEIWFEFAHLGLNWPILFMFFMFTTYVSLTYSYLWRHRSLFGREGD